MVASRGEHSWVTAVKPLWITVHNWRKMPSIAEEQSSEFESQYLPIAVMAFEPSDAVFETADIQGQQHLFRTGREILVDQSTQNDYGPADGKHFGPIDRGRSPEIGGQSFTIVGTFRLGTGLAANGAALTDRQGFARIAPWNVDNYVSLALIDVANGSKPEEVQRELEQRLRGITPASKSVTVEVLSKSDALDREQYRWLNQTPIGMIFQIGVVLSLLVGGAIVYMVLATDVSNRLSEYATLLAMGYSRKYLASIVMTQAVVLCCCGFLVAWLASELLYRLTSSASGIPISMNVGRILMVFGLGIAMSCTSGLLALRKLWKAEPANLF